MKTNMMTKLAAVVMAVLMLAATLTACGGKEVTLSINDMGTKTEVTAKAGAKVSDILTEAGITLGDKDETEPPVDSAVTEETAEILVKRFVTVTVAKDGEEKKVELVGGTVEDAINASGFKLLEGEEPDADPKSYLKDGMTIGFTKEVKVQLTADGETKEALTKSATVEALLKELGVTLGDDDEVSEKLDTKLADGMKIVVKRVEYKEEKKTEKIAYATKEDYSSSMAQGTSEVTQSGSEGEKEVTYKVKYVDGKEDSREALSEKVIKDAVDEIITYGTATGSGSSSGGQTGRYEVSRETYYDCDGSGHGYYDITYSDGTHEYIEF